MITLSKQAGFFVVLFMVISVQQASAAIMPNMISGLKAWYDSNTLAGTNLTPVSSWTDSSGNGFHLTASGSSNPTIVTSLGVNNHRGVHFVRLVADQLTRSTFNNSSASSIFVVVQVLSSNAAHGMWIDGISARQTLYHYNNEYSIFAGAEQRDVLAGAGGTNDFALHRYMATFNSANSIGGVDGLESGLVNPSNGTIGTLVVGDHTGPGDGNDATVNIAEVIIYNRALSPLERAQIEEYLTAKFFVAPVPEPSTLALLGLGCSGLVLKARRRRSAA